MRIVRLAAWPKFSRRNVRGRTVNWRGPRRALTLDEQLEIQHEMDRAKLAGRRWSAAAELAVRYGVSSRTIWRYLRTTPVPAGLEFLRPHLEQWARERDIRLTTDDLITLLVVIARHRDAGPTQRPVPRPRTGRPLSAAAGATPSAEARTSASEGAA